MNNRIRQNDAGAAGDPDRAAEIIVQAAHRENPSTQLLLGVNAVEISPACLHRRLAEATAWEKVSRSADDVEPYPASFPADVANPA